MNNLEFKLKKEISSNDFSLLTRNVHVGRTPEPKP
jgi:hypothetical protein